MAVRQSNPLVAQAVDQGRALLQEATGQVRHQADLQAGRLVGGIQRIALQAYALAEGRPEDAGPFDDYAMRFAERLSELAEDLNEEGIEGAVRRVGDLARARPALFLAGAAVIGAGVGRLLRAGREEPEEDEVGPPRIGTYR